jgi:hypothetical protein
VSVKPFAHGTEVSVEKSRAELETLLGKRGATHRVFSVDDEAGMARIGFAIASRKYALEVPLPKIEPPLTSYGWPKSFGEEPPGFWRLAAGQKAEKIRARWEQACRERWRAVVLTIKAKLELVRIGLSTVEREFMADMLLPDGSTVGKTVGAYLEKLIADGYHAPLALPEARP